MAQHRPDIPVIDPHLDPAFTEHSNRLLRELLQLFLQEASQFQRDIDSAFDAKQTQRLDELLHKLLGSCIYCGLLRLKTSLIELREAIQVGNYAPELLDDFHREMENALERAKKEIRGER